MDEITLTVNPSLLRAIVAQAKFMRDHCDDIINAIAQMKPLPDKPIEASTPPAAPIARKKGSC